MVTRRGLAALVSLLVAAGTPVAGASDDPLRNLQYGLDRAQVESAWSRARGAGVAIAVIDTGVDLLHEDLSDRLIQGRDFIDGDDAPQDENGHGTHVAGVAAAATDNGIGVAGVAPDASLMPLRVLDARGTGVESNVVEAIGFAVRRTRELGMRLVVNLSLTDLEVSGTPASSRQIEEAIRGAWQAGAVIVAAAGNESLPYSDYPAAGPNVLSVGATDAEDRRAGFSNRGPVVVGPGDKIVSTYWDPATPDDHAVYASGSGTSMAAPHVAGVAALLLSTGLDNEGTVDRIISTADDLGPRGRDDEFGFGRVSAARALGVASASPPGGAVAPPEAPLGAEGRFEAISTPPAEAEQAAPSAPAVSDGIPRGAVIAAAALLLALAYVGARWGAVQEASVVSTRESGPGPWER